MNNLDNNFISFVDYASPLAFAVTVAFLIWLTFSQNGRKLITGLVDVAYVSSVLGLIWILFLATLAILVGIFK